MLKRINIFRLMAIACAISLYTNGYANDLYDQGARVSLFSGNNGCKSDFEEFKRSVEIAIYEKVKGIECELAKIFCDRKEFIRNRLAALTICLKELIAYQQQSTNAHLKDFIACQFNKTEERIQEDIVHKVDCVQELFCKQINTLESDIQKILCELEVDKDEMMCINTQLADFIKALNNNEGENNPFNGAFDEFDICYPTSECNQEECVAPSTCTTTC